MQFGKQARLQSGPFRYCLSIVIYFQITDGTPPVMHLVIGATNLRLPGSGHGPRIIGARDRVVGLNWELLVGGMVRIAKEGTYKKAWPPHPHGDQAFLRTYDLFIRRKR